MKTDILIIGGGCAGLSAAIYGVRAGRSVLVLEGRALGGQIINTPDIENYPGIAHISGFEFAMNLSEQAKALGAEIRMEEVLSLTKEEGIFHVQTSGGSYEASAVILATGAKNRPLGLPREQELIGKGISYCATCDGMFFRRKDVAVNGGGNTALEDAAFLAKYCNKVWLIHRRDAFRGDEKSVERLRSLENVEFILNSTVTGLDGDGKLESIRVTDKFTGEETSIPVSGLFIAIGQAPVAGIFADLAELDAQGYLVADESCRTKTPGLFAAGDARTKTVRQLATAASDGAAAALAAAKYLDEI